jgi:hypothetical protein
VPKYAIEVRRTVIVAVEAWNALEAMSSASAVAWQWQPEEADGGDQGTVSTRVVDVSE